MRGLASRGTNGRHNRACSRWPPAPITFRREEFGMHGYAVIDVETTGLRVGRHDRVIEVGVVELDAVGSVVGEWGTLINPVRDLGPASLHGIRAADVRCAPPFERVAGKLAGMLAGRVVVAHN